MIVNCCCSVVICCQLFVRRILTFLKPSFLFREVLARFVLPMTLELSINELWLWVGCVGELSSERAISSFLFLRCCGRRPIILFFSGLMVFSNGRSQAVITELKFCEFLWTLYSCFRLRRLMWYLAFRHWVVFLPKKYCPNRFFGNDRLVAESPFASSWDVQGLSKAFLVSSAFLILFLYFVPAIRDVGFGDLDFMLWGL